MTRLLVRAFGWTVTVLFGDPCVFDRWLFVRKHLRPGPVRTLDAGSGSGAFTMYAAKRGNNALGLSFEERNNLVARERTAILGLENNIDYRTGDLRELDELAEGLGQFDQIICLETIEHILDDAKLLRDLSGLLTPGGRLLLTTPYVGHRALYSERLSDHEDGGHVRWGYSHADLDRLMQQAGLEVVERDYVSGVVSQKITNLYRRLSSVNIHFAWLVTFPLRIAEPLDRPLTRLLRFPYLCVAAVGEKR